MPRFEPWPIISSGVERAKASCTASTTPASSCGLRIVLSLMIQTSDQNRGMSGKASSPRSEEHTSELQSRENLVCRLLLEKKKKKITHKLYKTGFPRHLESTNPCASDVHIEPFPSAAFKDLTSRFATTTQSCTNGRAAWAH